MENLGRKNNEVNNGKGRQNIDRMSAITKKKQINVGIAR
jgi:hypothetical protein